MGWLIPVRVVFLLLSAILVLGRPTLGLVATLRGSSFSFSHLGNLVLLFHFSFCTDESADLLVLAMTFAFLRYSDTSSFITFLRMGSSFALSGWKMLIADTSKQVNHVSLIMSQLHRAPSDTNIPNKLSFWQSYNFFGWSILFTIHVILFCNPTTV